MNSPENILNNTLEINIDNELENTLDSNDEESFIDTTVQNTVKCYLLKMVLLLYQAYLI